MPRLGDGWCKTAVVGMDPDTGVIRVVRVPEQWRDKPRSYKVQIDGKIVAKMRDGETRDFEVSAGPHQLALKIDWSGSGVERLDVPSGGVVTYRCGPKGATVSSLWRMFTRQHWIYLRSE